MGQLSGLSIEDRDFLILKDVETQAYPQDQDGFPISKKFDFIRYIDPFIVLLATTAYQLSGFVGRIALYFAHHSNRIIQAVGVVFYRLIFAPPFDPCSIHFIKKINGFENQNSLIEKRILQLHQKFQRGYLFSQDISYLKKLDLEVNQVLDDLNFFIKTLEQDKRPMPIQGQLADLKQSYQNFQNQIDSFIQLNIKSIITQFSTIAGNFLKAQSYLPKEISQELTQTWENFCPFILSRLSDKKRLNSDKIYSELLNLENLINGLNNADHETEFKESLTDGPPELKNYRNNCYMNSAFQALLFSNDKVVEWLKETPKRGDPKTESDEQYQKKLIIHQELIQMMENAPKQGPTTQMELILYLLQLQESGKQSASSDRLRNEIFNSKLHSEFNPSSMYRQLDAAAMIEFLIDHFLPQCKFNSVSHTIPLEGFLGLEFINKEKELNTTIQIPLRDDKETEKQELFMRIRYVLDKVETKQAQRKFKVHPPKSPKTKTGQDKLYHVKTNGQGQVEEIENNLHIIRVRDQAKALAANSLQQPKQVVKHLVQFHELVECPPILVLHFKRFNAVYNSAIGQCEFIKKDSPVILPKDGIIDLDKFYSHPAGGPLTARYRIKSSIVHSGNFEGGHYMTYVEKNGKYYLCNDIGGNKEISKEEFLGHRDSYVLVLERLSDEEANAMDKDKIPDSQDLGAPKVGSPPNDETSDSAAT